LIAEFLSYLPVGRIKGKKKNIAKEVSKYYDVSVKK